MRSRGAAVGRVSVGDELRGTGRLALPSSSGDRFDYAAHLRRAGVHTVLYADQVAATGRRREGLNATLDAVRRRAERGVSAGLPTQTSALARGMVLGADEDIPAAMSQDFKDSGLAHVLAVSGQNVVLLAALAWPLLAAAGLGGGTAWSASRR